MTAPPAPTITAPANGTTLKRSGAGPAAPLPPPWTAALQPSSPWPKAATKSPPPPATRAAPALQQRRGCELHHQPADRSVHQPARKRRAQQRRDAGGQRARCQGHCAGGILCQRTIPGRTHQRALAHAPGLPPALPMAIHPQGRGHQQGGKTGEATRAVRVEKVAPPPPPPPPPYVARNVSATPALSFGQSPRANPRRSRGERRRPARARRRTAHAERCRHLRSARLSPGVTSYAKDPAQTASPSPPRRRLRPIHPQRHPRLCSTAKLHVSASSGTGATGVQWKALPADQPSGSLPPGITLDLGSPVNIAAGTRAPVNIQLTGSSSAAKAAPSSSNSSPRKAATSPCRAAARLPPAPGAARAHPSPTALELGVQQTKSVSGKITLTNQGYAPAQNVVRPAIGAIDLGQSALVQITARPGADVADGYHQFQLRIRADNDAGGTVPITIAVVRDGQGNARFKLVDIYTNTLNAKARPLKAWRARASRCKNEALTNDVPHPASNAQGLAEFNAIRPATPLGGPARQPPGRQRAAHGLFGPHPPSGARLSRTTRFVSIEQRDGNTIKDELTRCGWRAPTKPRRPPPSCCLETHEHQPCRRCSKAKEFRRPNSRSATSACLRADNLKFCAAHQSTQTPIRILRHHAHQYGGQEARVVIPYRITALAGTQKRRARKPGACPGLGATGVVGQRLPAQRPGIAAGHSATPARAPVAPASAGSIAAVAARRLCGFGHGGQRRRHRRGGRSAGAGGAPAAASRPPASAPCKGPDCQCRPPGRPLTPAAAKRRNPNKHQTKPKTKAGWERFTMTFCRFHPVQRTPARPPAPNGPKPPKQPWTALLLANALARGRAQSQAQASHSNGTAAPPGIHRKPRRHQSQSPGRTRQSQPHLGIGAAGGSTPPGPASSHPRPAGRRTGH
ncbi:hypothetical protein FQR65_LT08005 [Abscondita terminalis]|nr:hypothetical protein FQR65_LT08005 [Abscondita terminalis]